MTRRFGNNTFRCERPGVWLSSQFGRLGRVGIYRLMAGTSAEQWEVYSAVGSDDPLYDGELIGCGTTMAEAACEAFGLDFNQVYRPNGIASSPEGNEAGKDQASKQVEKLT